MFGSKLTYKKNNAESPQAQLKDKAARRIAGGIVSAQTRLSGYLSAAEGRCSTRQKKIIFFTFCLLTSGYCLYILGDALMRSDPPTLQKIQIKGHTTKPAAKGDTSLLHYNNHNSKQPKR